MSAADVTGPKSSSSSTTAEPQEAHHRPPRDLLEIHQLIDLTDKPIRLSRDEIGWSRVRTNGSNCICCCNNNSITLVTTNDSYILDHIPLDNIQLAQANSSLQYLALSNERQIAIIDLVDNELGASAATKISSSSSNNNNHDDDASHVPRSKLQGQTRLVNLASSGLSMADVLFWRWLDHSSLAILTNESLFACSVSQPQINHPALTALSRHRPQLLSLDKLLDLDQRLVGHQITDVQRDPSGGLYAISSLYLASRLSHLSRYHHHHHHHRSTNDPQQEQSGHSLKSSTLRPSFGSVPSRLSQLVNNDHSFDSLRSEHLLDPNPRRPLHNSTSTEDEIRGLVQIYCKFRDRSQVIQAHCVTFATGQPKANQNLSGEATTATILISANRSDTRMRVHFIEMATSGNNLAPGAQSASSVTDFGSLDGKDFPTSIVCSAIDTPSSPSSGQPLQIAMITTKYGQLFVYSVAHSTILFKSRIVHDIVSGTIVESRTKGLMVICRNGQVLLVKLNPGSLMKLLEDSKRLRHISSSQNILSSIDVTDNKIGGEFLEQSTSPLSVGSSSGTGLDIGLEVLISTKL